MKTNEDFSSLIQLLSTEQLGLECLDFIEAHGYITATIISPEVTHDEQLFLEILGENAASLDADVTQDFRSGILQLKTHISRQLLMAEALDMPCELSIGSENEPSDFERWCMAFVEKHFMAEDAWFTDDEPVVANLLLPFICGSGLVDDPEIEKMRSDIDFFASMLEDIPELVIDLYAFYHEKSSK